MRASITRPRLRQAIGLVLVASVILSSGCAATRARRSTPPPGARVAWLFLPPAQASLKAAFSRRYSAILALMLRRDRPQILAQRPTLPRVLRSALRITRRPRAVFE